MKKSFLIFFVVTIMSMGALFQVHKVLASGASGSWDSPTTVTPLQNPNTSVPNNYNLLAPIGGITSINSTTTTVGQYLNILFMIAIGVCGGLAVVMIVLDGVTMMTTDSVFGKAEAKGRTMGAIGGLLLALGAYAILRTINPAFVSTTVTIPQVNVELDGSQPILSDAGTSIPSGAVGTCSQGIVTVGVFHACASIAPKLQAMLAAASAAGITLTGGGFRTLAQQTALYNKNCSNGTCNPPTAKPGTSNHESGLAFDFKCNGTQIEVDLSPATKVCMDWLNANAGTYGFYNLNGEDWHWSVDGH